MSNGNKNSNSSSDWIKTASATFAGGALAVSLVAIPTFIWLPSELADIKDGLDEARAASNTSAKNSSDALEASNAAVDSIEALTYNVALASAVPVGFAAGKDAFTGGMLESQPSRKPLVHVNAMMSSEEFLANFPIDARNVLRPKVERYHYLYSQVGPTRWIFVTMPHFNELNSTTQSIVRQSLKSLNFKFVVLAES